MARNDTTEGRNGEPTHDQHEYGIETHLETYRFVEGVEWDSEHVSVEVDKERSNYYDHDSVIGTLIRHFDLSFDVKLHDPTRLRFVREDVEEVSGEVVSDWEYAAEDLESDLEEVED